MIMLRKKQRQLQKPDIRFDERDTMFARAVRIKNTPEYDDYYTRRPDLKKIDDNLRELQQLLSPKGKYYDPDISPKADQYFEDIGKIVPDPEIVDKWIERIINCDNTSKVLRELTIELGAVACGFTKIPDEFTYSHKGRLDQNYGDPINNEHKSMLVFLVEMDYRAMKQAPGPSTICESAHQYFRAARIAKTINEILVKSGIKAKAEFDANYNSILPPLAELAGLGEVGRNNILIADKYGSRVRIGAVRIDQELEYDSPITLGVENFCEICKKCADNCPSKALSQDSKVYINGVEKWPTNVEACYGYWRSIGTDCGICMAACPFSHRNNWFHNLVRWMVKTLPWSRRIALFFDDLIYGRKWKMPTGARKQ